MSWLPVIGLAAAVFALAVFALRLPRDGWALFGAALLFALAGYAWQGSPGYAGAPGTAAPNAQASDAAGAVEARRALFESRQPSRFVTIADGFARRGQFGDAANLLRNAVEDNPRDAEAWLALGHALVEYADGTITPAAELAFARAQELEPEHPGAAFFLGIAQLRAGDPVAARATWQAQLDRAPEDAQWRGQLEDRITVLDELMRQSEAMPTPPSGTSR